VLVAWRLLARITQLRPRQSQGWQPQPAPEAAGVAPVPRMVARPRQLALVRGYDERGPPTHR